MLHPPPDRRLFALIVQAPLDRLADVPAYGRALGALAALLSLVTHDVLAGILGLLVASAFVDYYLGRACAKRADAYDSLRAQAGALTKLSAIAMLLLIRGFEAWAAGLELPGIGQTNGGIAAALAVGLFIVDLESIERHRTCLKARPIPGFSQLVMLLRAVEQRLAPSLVTRPPAMPGTPQPERAE